VAVLERGHRQHLPRCVALCSLVFRYLLTSAVFEMSDIFLALRETTTSVYALLISATYLRASILVG
jgi:hypothetical protein